MRACLSGGYLGNALWFRHPSGLRGGSLCFNNFHKLFVALGDGDAGVSLAPLRQTGRPVPPLLRALLVSFGIPAIRHQEPLLPDITGAAHFSNAWDSIKSQRTAN
jgi:hypothetical protein